MEGRIRHLAAVAARLRDRRRRPSSDVVQTGSVVTITLRGRRRARALPDRLHRGAPRRPRGDVAGLAARRRAASGAPGRRRGRLRGPRRRAQGRDRRHRGLTDAVTDRRVTPDEVPDPPGCRRAGRSSCPAAGTTFVRELAGPAGRADGRAAARLDRQRRAQLVRRPSGRWPRTSTSSPSTTAATAGASAPGGGSASRTAPTTSPRWPTSSGIDRIIPVGYSMGGPIAQLVWRRHPDRVDGLVLCATSRNFGTGGARRSGHGVDGRHGLAHRPGHPSSVCSARSAAGCSTPGSTSPSSAGGPASRCIQNDTRMVVEAGPGAGRVLVARLDRRRRRPDRGGGHRATTRPCRPIASAGWPTPSPAPPCTRSPATTASAAPTRERSSPASSTPAARS